MEAIASTSSSQKTKINYLPPCKIVNNVVIADEVFIYEERFGIGELLFEKLNSNPDFIGQIDATTGARVTFAEIKRRSIRCALWLKDQGVQRGDIIGISTLNHSDSAIILLGCLFIGAFVYFSFETNIHECRYFISLMKPKVLFVDYAQIMLNAVDKEDLDIVVTLIDEAQFQSLMIIDMQKEDTAIDEFRCTPIVNLDEIAILIPSCRKNKLAKMVTMSHRALISNMLSNNSFAADDQKIIMYVKSFHWLNDTIILFQSIYFYKTRIITKKCDEKVMCELLKKYKVEWTWLKFSTANNMLKKDLFSKYRLSSLKKMVIGNASMLRGLQQELTKVLSHTEIIFIYKMDEIYGVNILQRKYHNHDYAINNAQLKVINVEGEMLGSNKLGEFLWKSPRMTAGYYGNLSDTKAILDENGWLHSGEYGFYDAAGNVHVNERSSIVDKDCAYPSQIESQFETHEAIKEIGVILDEVNASNNEHIVAFVSKISEESITEDILEREIIDAFEDYKPFHCEVIFLNSLPRTARGTIAYEELKRELMSRRIELEE